MEKFLLRDSSGKKSVTMTSFVIGFLIVNIKLLISGLELNGYKMETFSGSDYAAALAALGAIYVMRRATGKETSDESKK